MKYGCHSNSKGYNFFIIVSSVVTINKSWVQSLSQVNIFLNIFIFAYEQLYVVVYKVTSITCFKTLTCDNDNIKWGFLECMNYNTCTISNYINEVFQNVWTTTHIF